MMSFPSALNLQARVRSPLKRANKGENMKKGVTIELDKPRTLRYGMNALAKIEDITGKTIMALDLNSLGIKDLLVIVYAGLCHEDKSLTIEQVGDLLDEYADLTMIAEKVGEALTEAFGKPKGNEKGE
nr:MAG TPA: tail tube protein [Bacteriophage sp.]